MRANRKSAKPDWQFDGSTISVRIPMTWTRRGGRKVIIAPEGGDAWAPAKPRPDATLIRALARAHRWKRSIEHGAYTSAAEIAEAEGVTRSFVNRILRLTLLAPDIQEIILDGRQPKGAQLEELTKTIPSGWEEARSAWRARQSLGIATVLGRLDLGERATRNFDAMQAVTHPSFQTRAPHHCVRLRAITGAARRLSAAIVSVGLAVADVGKTPLPTMKRFARS